MKRIRTIIMGAAGRDFHNFNTFYRNNQGYEVVAFTAAQIPNIDGRKYPAELSGELYPRGIDIYPEEQLPSLIEKFEVDEVVIAYSDLSNDHVMSLAAIVNAAGADFKLMGQRNTEIKSTKPVIAICASRTGSGKSQTTRRVVEIIQSGGRKVVAIRHPMPYGDLSKQRVQRFATFADLDSHQCTIEEREEYEPHLKRGTVVYAGVDYEAILRQAEQEADVILWDGGNNDTPFYQPDLMITVVDPHRPGDELHYYPGQANLRMADVVIINKIDTAAPEGVQMVRESIHRLNQGAIVVDAASPIFVDEPDLIRNSRVLVIEDGPTLTHGGMRYGAGVVAAQKFGAAEIVDPRPYTVGSITQTFTKYPAIGTLLPAMGYGEQQVRELEETINRVPCDVVVIGTPIDLRKLVNINKPALHVGYDLQEIGKPNLIELLGIFIRNLEDK